MPIGEIFHYSIGRAVRSVLHNFRTLPGFFVAGWIGIAVGVVGLWLRRRDRSTLALVALAVSFPAGYFFFWGSLLESPAGMSGPIYYLPLYVPACIFLATTLIAWRRRRTRRRCASSSPSPRSVPRFQDRRQPQDQRSTAALERRHPVDPRPRLVIVADSGPYLMHLNPYSGNQPDLDSRILFAVDWEAEDLDLIAAHGPNALPRRARPTRGSTTPSPITRARASGLVDAAAGIAREDGDLARAGHESVTSRPSSSTSGSANTSSSARHATDARGLDLRDAVDTRARRTPEVGRSSGTAAEGRGAIQIDGAATTWRTPSAGNQVQELFFYRVDADTGLIDVLYRAATTQARRLKRKLELTAVDRLRFLDVQVTTDR